MKMIDLEAADRSVQSEIKSAMDRVIAHGRFINGPEVRAFEEAIEQYLGVTHVVGCGNGTDALSLAFQALELPIGSEVIMPSFNYVAAAETAMAYGLKPVFAEVCEDDFGLSPEAVREAVNEQTSAIVAVHLFGQACRIGALKEIADESGIKLIEDNAQSLGAKATVNEESKFLSTIGDIATNSFFPTKNLGCYGDGGCMVTQNEQLATKYRELAKHGQSRKYYYEAVGRNSRLDTIQAAMLTVKLKELDQQIARRRANAAYYGEHLGGIEDLILPPELNGSVHTYNQFTIRVRGNRRDALRQYLSENGIPSIVYYPHPLHLTPAYENCPHDDLRVSEKLSEEVLSLPVYPNMPEADLALIVEKLLSYFAAKTAIVQL